MEKTRKIGIYGGTFAPPHNGHVYAALSFYDRFDLDALYIIPSFIPPHKQVDANDDPVIRLEMTRLAFSSHPDYGKKIFISDVELARGGRSYTAETLAHFHRTVEGDLYFLCGTDMILSMDTWYDPAYIFKAATIVYVRREDERALDEPIEAKIRSYRDRFGATVLPLSVEAHPLSSTDIRQRRAAGESIASWVPEAVARYISEHGLYRQGKEKDE